MSQKEQEVQKIIRKRRLSQQEHQQPVIQHTKRSIQIKRLKSIISVLEMHYVQKSNREKAAWYKTMWTENQYDFYGLLIPVSRKEDEKVTTKPTCSFHI